MVGASIFILNLTPGSNGLSEGNCKRIQETFKFLDLVWLIQEVLRSDDDDDAAAADDDDDDDVDDDDGYDWWKFHDDAIKWKHFPRYWPFVRGIHRSPVNSPHKGQWRGALMFSLICAWINGWVYNREAGDLRRHRAHYDVSVMSPQTVLFEEIFIEWSYVLYRKYYIDILTTEYTFCSIWYHIFQFEMVYLC